jgi:hypothetical protein
MTGSGCLWERSQNRDCNGAETFREEALVECGPKCRRLAGQNEPDVLLGVVPNGLKIVSVLRNFRSSLIKADRVANVGCSAQFCA